MDQKILATQAALELITDVFASAINESELDKVTVRGLAMACADFRMALERSQAIIDHQLEIEHDRNWRIQDDIRKYSQTLYSQLRRS